MSTDTEDPRRVAITRAKEGHSLLITGQCGTGKTYILREIVKELTPTCVVALTATTGMASAQLGLDATTLHHWAGIMDGRYSEDKLAELIDGDDQFASAKERILKTHCLVIDEISMLSSNIFGMVEFVVRHIKQNKKTFGGIQVIGCGDFKQLPPVPNHRYNDDGKFCFENSLFWETFPHHIHLQTVVRQTETALINAVNQLCDGMPTEETVQFVKGMDRPLDVPSHEVTRLYGTNFDAQYVNQEMLEEIDAELFVFKAKDEGNVNCLRNINIPKTLLLKKGAKVILVKNLGPGLYNGLQGRVHELVEGKTPVIDFNGKLVPLSPTRFDVYDSVQQKSIACRMQLPVILAFALTVHRAQGQTLRYVEIDCFSFFAPGQMGVALSRAVSSQGLRVVNFNMVAANRKHPDVVYNFYDNVFSDFKPNLLCCHKKATSLFECEEPMQSSSHVTEQSHQSASAYVLQDIIDTEELPMLESPWDIGEFCAQNSSATFSVELSTDLLASDRFKDHVNFLYYNVNNIMSETLKTSQQWTHAYTKLNSFIVSDLHMASILNLFQVKMVNKLQNKLSSKIVFWLMDNEVNKKSKEITDKQSEKTERVADTELSSASKSKIRYLAGACVQKIAKRLKESVLRKIGQS